ncbi:MarR family winged helix-turn-helix transcriptional regulator [Nocardia fluminea]|uniref:MarR family winged helix-turn-helix transcriptional regulator n=1 Tax=Nocardia fluminea TaxID=134984 RepID=UPI003D0B04A3
MTPDAVKTAIEQWRSEHPDADLTGLEFNGRLHALQRQLDALSAGVLAEHDLLTWEWDVLSVLWRHRESPVVMSALGNLLLIAPGSVTNRIARLEQRGFVARTVDPASRRRVLVALTADGERKLARTLPHVLEASTRLHRELVGVDLAQVNEQLSMIAGILSARSGD